MILKNMVCVVTGVARGTGETTARRFVTSGQTSGQITFDVHVTH